jgi:hypothetical protein
MRAVALALAVCLPCACLEAPILAEGQYGRPIPLATGDDSPLPRLMFRDEGCPGTTGGCGQAGSAECRPLLVDSLVPISALENRDPGDEGSRISVECLEIRAAGGMTAPSPSAQDLARSVARFRFADLPVVRAHAAATGGQWWQAGDDQSPVAFGGVLGGNLMRQFALELSHPPLDPEQPPESIQPPSLTLYTEFPGSDPHLADQGRAFLPMQFPGRLLGRGVNDQCDVGGDDCEIKAFDLDPDRNVLALESTRMVMDACIAAPPCTITYAPDLEGGEPGGPECYEGAGHTCSCTTGPDTAEPCVDPVDGGKAASMVVATGVPGMVLFEDSVRRLFGDLDDPGAIPPCDSTQPETAACWETRDAALRLAGWPPTADSGGLTRLRIRSLALVPGLVASKGPGPCERLRDRTIALEMQCERFVAAVKHEGNVPDTDAPYAATDPSSNTSMAVLGEAFLAPEAGPMVERWIPTIVLPTTHPLVLALRRDVTPEALQPDGLIGTVLLEGTKVVLDYTDPNPGLRLRCLDPTDGGCLSAPDCSEDRQAACCFGMPLPLLLEFIQEGADDLCCAALSATQLADIQAGEEHCQGYDPP